MCRCIGLGCTNRTGPFDRSETPRDKNQRTLHLAMNCSEEVLGFGWKRDGGRVGATWCYLVGPGLENRGRGGSASIAMHLLFVLSLSTVYFDIDIPPIDDK